MRSIMDIKVALVFETDFSKELSKLASQISVWIVKSPINTPIVKELRLQDSRYNLTEFLVLPLEPKPNLFHRIIYSLDEHHNQLSQDPPYNTLLVYGLGLESVDQNVLKELGFCQSTKTEYGFMAKKAG